MKKDINADLLSYCRDLHEWPESWKGLPEDLECGERILEEFKPFIRFLIQKGLSRKTIKKHIDNLWLLGGEIISRFDDDASLRKVKARTLISDSVDEEGPSLIASSQHRRGATIIRCHMPKTP